MKNVIALIPCMLAACSNGTVPAMAQAADPVENIRAQTISHAPYKQWDLATGRPNKAIGRTPGAACETISYLVADAAAHPKTSAATSRQAVTLADWVLTRQAASATLPVPGGVASTPDLPAPGNAYHYAIDAAFCASAMLDLADTTGDTRYERSAAGFGDFLLGMMRDGDGRAMRPGTAGRAPCEAVVQTSGGKPAWNCQRHVKMLVALPTLDRLERTFPGRGYAQAAIDTRSTLMPGLEGLWEYAEPNGARLRWRRIDGPQGERDTFVYGDTLAYALKGLHGTGRADPDARRLYARFADMKGKDQRTSAYDGHLAFAGYIRVDARGDGAPDPDSAYYDIVTMGILDPLRRDVAPADAAKAVGVIRDVVGRRPAIGWHMRMDLSSKDTGTGDISTLAAIGTALARSAGNDVTTTVANNPANAAVGPVAEGARMKASPATTTDRPVTIKVRDTSTAPDGKRSRALPPG